jgi:hypothetical protein
MEKLAQSGGGTIYVSVKILFARAAAATIFTRKHRWLWPYRLRRAALSGHQRGQAFPIAVCGQVVAKNQPLVVAYLARDPCFAESPFLINMDFAFTPEYRCLVPARPAFRGAFSLESG